MKITKAIKKDVSDLKRISREAIIESVEVSDSIKNEIISDTERHIDENIDTSNCVFLKYDEDRTVGFILVKEYWNLSDLFVTPERSGIGIGTKLLDEALSVCKSNSDVDYIRVNSSRNAEGFYRKYGFETFHHMKDEPDYIASLIYRF